MIDFTIKSILLTCILSFFLKSSWAQAQTNEKVLSLLPEMIRVETIPFEMGSNTGEKNEQPPHRVVLEPFLMARYEVSQELWQAVMGNNPSYFKDCPLCPVEEVTPQDIDDFLNKLSAISGKPFRLPTEAEWEFAAMGGVKSKGFRYSGSNQLDEVGWVKSNAGEKTHPVGQKKPNELGLFDMAGNVWELCQDYWDPGYYRKSPEHNPINTRPSVLRVARGGSWRSGEERCYNKARNRNVPDHHKQNGGFRLVLSVAGKTSN